MILLQITFAAVFFLFSMFQHSFQRQAENSNIVLIIVYK